MYNFWHSQNSPFAAPLANDLSWTTGQTNWLLSTRCNTNDTVQYNGTASPSSFAVMRAIGTVSSGQYYAEVAFTQTSIRSFIGVLDNNPTLASSGGRLMVLDSALNYSIWTPGSTELTAEPTGVSGTFLAGDMICIHFDATYSRIRYRINDRAWGNWLSWTRNALYPNYSLVVAYQTGSVLPFTALVYGSNSLSMPTNTTYWGNSIQGAYFPNGLERLTSNSTSISGIGTYTAFGSTKNTNADVQYWKVFNNLPQDYPHGMLQNSSNSYPMWVGCSFPSAKTFTKMAMRSGTYLPKTFTIQGSNDGTDWTIISTHTNVSMVNETFSVFNISNPGSYTHYRVHVTAGSGTVGQDYSHIGNIIFH